MMEDGLEHDDNHNNENNTHNEDEIEINTDNQASDNISRITPNNMISADIAQERNKKPMSGKKNYYMLHMLE